MWEFLTLCVGCWAVFIAFLLLGLLPFAKKPDPEDS